MLALIKALEFVLPQIPDDAKVIPGHGVVSTRADVVRGLEVLKGIQAVVETAVQNGKTLEQLTAERPFDESRRAARMGFVRQVTGRAGQELLSGDRPEATLTGLHALQEFLVGGQVRHHAGDRGAGGLQGVGDLRVVEILHARMPDRGLNPHAFEH